MFFMQRYLFVIVFTFVLLPFVGFGGVYRGDSILIKAPNRISLGGRVIVVKRDTIIHVSDSLEFIFLKQNKRILKNLDKKRSNLITEHLRTWLFAGKPDTNQMDLSRREYLNNYRGRIVRNIKINNIDVFGATLTSNTPEGDRNWVERTGNKIHTNTSKNLLYKALNIKKGDRIAPFELSEKEVVIRNLPYISDVMITPRVVPMTDSVDLDVFVQDVWSIGFHIEPQDTYKGYFEVYDENAFGQGQEILVRMRYNTRRSPGLGSEAYYTINNIGREIIKTKIGYSSYFDYRDVKFEMQKDYYYKSNYAFGVLEQDYSNLTHFASDKRDAQIKVTVNDLWLGKGFPLGGRERFDITNLQLYVAARFGKYRFNGDRDVSIGKNNALHNRQFYLTSVAFAKQWYRQTKLLLGYGRTEDVPYGYKFEFVGGAESGEFRNRAYFAFKTAAGDFFDLGYCSGLLEVGSYLKKDSLQQGVVKAGLFYYSNLARLGMYRFRQFVGLDYNGGFNRFSGYGERIYLKNSNGIRGFTSDSVRSTKRAFARFETLCYSPHTVWGFKLAYFAYTDFAWMNHYSNNIFEGPLYYGVGVGIRIRNERLAFKTFSIRLALYPNIPKGGSPEFLDIAGADRLSLSGFKPGRPDMVIYE